MLCQMCKKHQATIHLTEIVNNQKKEVHLCEKCAEKQGVVKTQMSIADFLQGLASGGKPKSREELPDIKCPSCGMTLSDFQNGGRFGCADDYAAFRERIMPLIEKIHDSTQHVGKMPKRTDREVVREKSMRQLQAELKRAVEREEYEEAARIRDRIREIETVGGAGGEDAETPPAEEKDADAT
ncbi:MAG: UvrB/UvrC motif-containing protein [Planctomycetota bacterium]|jgi:protein arginine kinase activator